MMAHIGRTCHGLADADFVRNSKGLLTLILIEALLPQMRPVKARGVKFGASK